MFRRQNADSSIDKVVLGVMFPHLSKIIFISNIHALPLLPPLFSNLSPWRSIYFIINYLFVF